MPLTLYQRPDSPRWWLRGTIGRRRIRESTGTDDRALAEEYRAQRETALYRAAIHGEAGPVTFAAAALSYLDVAERSPSTRHRLGRLLPHIGSALTCRQIDQATLDRVARATLAAKARPATRMREIVTPVRAVLQHAARRGWCQVPAFEAVRLPPSRTLWVTPPEAALIVAAGAPHLRPLLEYLLCTGCRLGEALALDWRDIDLEHRRATVHQTKSGRDRIVDLAPRAIAALHRLQGRDGRVFRRPDGNPYAPKDGLGGGQIKRAWAGALRRSGVAKDATPHTLRHTWASWRYAVHRDLLRLKEEGGWQSVKLVERYAHLAPEGIAADALAFWGMPTEKPQMARRRTK